MQQLILNLQHPGVKFSYASSHSSKTDKGLVGEKSLHFHLINYSCRLTCLFQRNYPDVMALNFSKAQSDFGDTTPLAAVETCSF